MGGPWDKNILFISRDKIQSSEYMGENSTLFGDQKLKRKMPDAKITMGNPEVVSNEERGCYFSNEVVERLGQCLIASGGLTSVINGFFCIFTFRISLIVMGLLYCALGTFALLAETSFLCVCLMDKEWYRNFLERVNFGHFRKAIFYTVAPLLLLIICSIILYHMGYIFATVLFIAGSVCNFIIHRRVN